MRRQPRSPLMLAIISAFAMIAFVGVVALGIWQLERRAWKHALIAQVGARVHAAAVPAPGPSEWKDITANHDAYRRVTVRGRYLNDRETYVRATTSLGSGYWVLTPLRSERGFTVLVNRGFVPPERHATHDSVEGIATVTGLLRITETDGSFLRGNDPAHNRWYSRDVAAMARAKRLSNVAPYFIDADADPMLPKGAPVGGLTVISFSDNHLAYALTWFAMALMVLIGAAHIAREEWRGRKTRSAAP